MTLAEWVKTHGFAYTEVAKLIGCSPPYPGMIARDKVRPSYRMACRIEEVTAGMVPRTNWYPSPLPQIGEAKDDWSLDG